MRVPMSLLLSLVACGDSSQSPDAGLDLGFPDATDVVDTTSSAVALVELCDGYARACCKLQICFNPGQSALEDGCVEAVRERCDDGVFGPVDTHVRPGNLSYSADAAGACLAPYLAATCEGLGEVTGAPAIECEQVFVGSLAAGEACDFDQMCAGDLFCKPSSEGTCPGTCAARAKLGEACNESRQLCDKDLVCTGFGDREGTCVAAEVARDAACELLLQCPSGQFCDDDLGRCRDLIAQGEACPGFGCVRGLNCNGNPGTCEPLPGEGSPCEFTCAAGLECDASREVCVTAPSEVGDPCIDSFAPCGRGNGLQCRNSDKTCVGPAALGAPCGGDSGISRCDFGWCDGDFQTVGQCRPWKAFGDPCERFDGSCGPFECFQGKCALRGGPCRGPRLDEW
jgi:hypothetical protein